MDVSVPLRLLTPRADVNDGYCGFEIVEARDIDVIGVQGVIDKIVQRVGTTEPVYLSLDIDTLDPACKLMISVFPRPARVLERAAQSKPC